MVHFMQPSLLGAELTMLNQGLLATLLLSSSVALAQGTTLGVAASPVQASATVPIVFTNTVSADRSHAGDVVLAKTSQSVQLANGRILPTGAKVVGHITAADAFVYDQAPYAHQKPSILSIHFDSVEVDGEALPLNVTVRAMADPLTSSAAREPGPSDLDPSETVTQIGGDELTPSESKVVNRDGQVVAYNKRGGVYAHLIPNGRCDGSDVEVSVGIYSASACGLYGFTDVAASEFGSASTPSTLTLISSRTSPKVWKHSTALLEVLPSRQAVASR
jgi:hypothetical protein